MLLRLCSYSEAFCLNCVQCEGTVYIIVCAFSLEILNQIQNMSIQQNKQVNVLINTYNVVEKTSQLDKNLRVRGRSNKPLGTTNKHDLIKK